ncbi:hypothetical protein OG417_44815 [Actinoallomurus sp. NBC_01490]|uniref:hypothetical protein n=1 Tax=Actinoallomurus sp. NBC_01490 TaxID=2903557 RepID=UPI002E3333EC|nr:hypothetical protein [Actinoallomurus sp. NBC_01490]
MEDLTHREFTARWETDVTDTSPQAAARQAWEHIRRPDSIANVFTIYDHQTGVAIPVDLSDGEQREDEA